MISNKEINEYRRLLFQAFKGYYGEPIKLPIARDLLKEILFFRKDDYSTTKQPYVFIDAFRDTVYPKIDFSNIDFTDVNLFCEDISKLHGVHVDPQKAFEKDLRYLKCGNADFGNNSFADVKVMGTNFKGSKNVIIDPQTIYENDLRDGNYPIKFTTSPIKYAFTNDRTVLKGSNYLEFGDTLESYRASKNNVRKLTKK